MRKETVIFGTLMLTIGGVLGFVAGFQVCERKLTEEFDDEDDEDFDDEEEVFKVEPVVKKKEEKDERKAPVESDPYFFDYSKQYREEEKAENEHPMDSDEDEEEDEDDLPYCYDRADEGPTDDEIESYINANANSVVPIPASEYHSDNTRMVNFEREEIMYFPDQDYLVNERGEIIEDESEYFSNLLNKYHFKTGNDTEIYIRNFPHEKDYWVIKEFNKTKEEVFGW